ncbi:MAG TPA: type II toxin-antitoxin system VapC family toxin [Candidatus Saccharimonadales bacterium]|nr:type II toxin-antitoxin system VapC family toxin [Candidatus Saccharimonadales bacterium]
MSGSTAYLDTSAFLKLLIREPESDALLRALVRWQDRASASLIRTEAIRAVRRAGQDAAIGPARRLLEGMFLVRLDEPLLDRAAELNPLGLRSLDAIHLAAALAVGPDLAVFLTYDSRLADAAGAVGLPVEAPL